MKKEKISDKKRPKKRSRAKDRIAVKAMSVRSALNGLPEHIAHLYEAVARYVENGGGHIVVAGGVQVQKWPEDADYNFRVAVLVTGKPPSVVDGNEVR